MVTYRRRGHAEHDDQHYQPREEREHWAAQDPLDRYVTRLRDEGWVEAADLKEVDDRVSAELDAAVATAEAAPLPDGETALSGVYA